jgi:multidrug efflux system membrane fusion protein
MTRIGLRSFGRNLALALGLTLVGCSSGPEVVSLPPPEVSVSQPIERDVTEYFDTTGRTTAVESVEVRARVPGYLVSVDFREGAAVKQGDLLFQIDPRQYQAAVLQAEGELARWEAELRKGEADVARNRRLLPKGAASEKDLETAIASKETADAQIKSAKARLEEAKLNLEYASITAPISGRVSRANVTVGNLIHLSGATSNVLTTLVSTNPIHVYFDVDEQTMLRYQEAYRQQGADTRAENIKELQIPVEIGLATEEGYPHRGVLDFIDNRVDPATGTILVRAVFDDPDGRLTPGLFGRVRMPYRRVERASLVTERAIGTDQGGKYLLVVNDKNVVEYRPVKLGMLSDQLRVITEGISPGEWVITSGIQRVRPGITVTPQRTAMLPEGSGPPGTGEKPSAGPQS